MKYNTIFISTSLLMLLLCSQLRAEDNFTISGTVKNSESGEALIGASILIKELPGTGVSSNAYGFYSLTIPKGTEQRHFIWNLAGKVADQFDADASISRSARTRRNYDAIGTHGFDLADGHFVVAAYLDLRAQFAQVLDQVV